MQRLRLFDGHFNYGKKFMLILFKIMSSLPLLVIALTVYGCQSRSESKEIKIEGEIGSYLESQIASNESLSNIGNGLFVQGNMICGWPESSGEYLNKINGVDYRIIIKPKLTEIAIANNKTIAIQYTGPSNNNIVLEENGTTVSLFSDSNYFNWQLHVDETQSEMAWIAFNKTDHTHSIYYYNSINNYLHNIVANRRTQYRHPKAFKNILYYHKSYIEDDGSITSSLIKYDIQSKSAIVEYASEYPYNILSYAITGDGDLLILQKTDSLYVTRVLLVSNGVILDSLDVSGYLSDLYYGKTATNNVFYTEAKKDSLSTWALSKFKVQSNRILLVNDESEVAQPLTNQFIDRTLPSPMEYYDIFSIYLNRFSPPIVGYSLGDNSYGLLSLTEAVYMRSFVNIASVSSDKSWWYILAEKATNLVSAADENINIADYSNSTGPHWSTIIFSADIPKFVPFLVQDASIIDALLLVAERLDKDELLNARFPTLKGKIDDLFKRNYEHYDRFHIHYGNDKYNIIEPFESYYIFPYNSPATVYDGVNVPFNMMMIYVRPLLIASKLYNDDKYVNDAASLARLFSRHIVAILVAVNSNWLE